MNSKVDHITFVTEGLTIAQRRALIELKGGDLVRTTEGWKATSGRFVPLIVVAKLRARRLVMLRADKRTATLTLSAEPIVEFLSQLEQVKA